VNDASTSPPPADSSANDSALLDAAGAAADTGTPPLFSDDFEGPQSLPRGWDTIATSDGTLVLDTSTSVSPSTSLRATAAALAAGAPGNAANVTVRKRFPMPAAQTTVAYDFEALVTRYDTANSANVVIGALQVIDSVKDLYELQLDIGVAKAGAFTVIFAEYLGRSDGGSSYVAHPVASTFPAGAWTAVRIELTAAQPPLARIYFNQSLVLETTVSIPISGTSMQISLGLSYVSAPSQDWLVNYDDAVYRAL
jgi:hypothetical protein